MNLKNCFYLIFILFSLYSGIEAKPYVTASIAAVFDIKSNQFIYHKKLNTRIPPASTIKLLTAMLVIDNMNLYKAIKVPYSVKKVSPYKLHLKPANNHKTIDLLYALLLRSANDAAHTLAVHTSGSEYKFSKLMNKKANKLGLKHSNFTNPHGLPDSKQYVTAKDLTKLVIAARKYPQIIEILNTKTKIFHGPGKKKTNLISRNKLLFQDFYPKVLGKTGYTHKSGRCFAGFTFGVKTPVIIILMRTKNRWNDLKKLAKWSNHYYRTKINANLKRIKKTKIKKYQQFFKEKGFLSGKIDGVWGTETQAALFRFQKNKNLKTDGIIGPKTLSYIHS